MRTPLASIEGAASTLLRGPAAPATRRVRDLAGTIVQESRRMGRLVANLLDMIRVESGALQVQKEWQLLSDVVGVALLRTEDQLHEHPVTTTLPADLPLVPVDEILLEQVFVNLLENAAKHTPAGTPIEIGAVAQPGEVVVTVADRGPGHPAGRGRARVREVPPAGELAGARRGAGAHHLPRHRDGPRRTDLGRGAAGRRGALPLHHSDHRHPADPGPRGRRRARVRAVSGEAAAGPLVLLIEDEPQMRRFLRTALSANDYRLVEAATAREGLAQAAGRNPDVILLDLGLPDRDGLDVARELRGWSAVPIIVLSARGREQDKVAALDLGADDYLTKPFGVDELLARIRVALRHAARRPGRRPGAGVRGGRRAGGPDPPRGPPRRARRCTSRPTEYKLLAVLIRHAGKGAHPRPAIEGSVGQPTPPSSRTTSGSTWPSSARSWRPIRRGPGCWSPSRGWAIG